MTGGAPLLCGAAAARWGSRAPEAPVAADAGITPGLSGAGVGGRSTVLGRWMVGEEERSPLRTHPVPLTQHWTNTHSPPLLKVPGEWLPRWKQ